MVKEQQYFQSGIEFSLMSDYEPESKFSLLKEILCCFHAEVFRKPDTSHCNFLKMYFFSDENNQNKTVIFYAAFPREIQLVLIPKVQVPYCI
jgi:hypothetical protein